MLPKELDKARSVRSKVVFLATGNVHKFHEARRVLAEFGISLAMLKVKAKEIQDDDVENVAKTVAVEAARNSNLPIIVEDSGLFVTALNGFPGPYSSYVYRTIGVEGILKLMEKIDNRNAYFKSAIAFCTPQSTKPVCFIGEVHGKIAFKARGDSGFGFDPIFEPENGGGKTFAEMNLEEKNQFSHRAKALRKFAAWHKSNRRI